MDFEVTAHTSRHIEMVEFNGEPCLLSNGTLVTIPALVELAHEESRHDALGLVHEIDGLFLGAHAALPDAGNKEKRLVSLKDEQRNDYTIIKQEKGENSYYCKLNCPFYCTVRITTARGFELELEGTCRDYTSD